ncbi:unnamed protein product [Lupinus luteus]|uniref:F-box domain-containing protein n=1 Tax=Lupinus luteus TaxID=3873 RepID=A0AAV1WIZ7_LUPLU
MGTPNEEIWPGVTSLPDFKSTFPKWPAKDLATVVSNLDPAGLDLLSLSATSQKYAMLGSQQKNYRQERRRA